MRIFSSGVSASKVMGAKKRRRVDSKLSLNAGSSKRRLLMIYLVEKLKKSTEENAAFQPVT
jgi:hypothetical protein